MAFTHKNLDRILKDQPKLGETLKELQDYVNANLTPAAGNRVQPPALQLGASAPVVQVNTPVAKQSAPPSSTTSHVSGDGSDSTGTYGGTRLR